MTKYYLGNYEEEHLADGKIRKLHYIHGGNGLAAIYVQNSNVDTLYYTYSNYQGNLLAVTDASGTVKERYAYGPWGLRKNPTNWSQLDSRPSFLFSRGYTLHEHLDGYGLINMNGRVYDPLMGQFLSPDPYIQSPGSWLNYNRYGYCMNNPLIYTDPDGEFIFTLLASVIPGAQFLLPLAISVDIGWMQGGMRASMQGQSFWSGAWKGAAVGIAGGGLGMIGGAGMPFAQNLLFGTAEGALVGGLDAALWGNDIGKGMLWGAAGGTLFTTLTSENFSNWTKGKGFYNNQNVLENFKTGKYLIPKGSTWQQEALNHFGFEGTYRPIKPKGGDNVDSDFYIGSVSPTTKQISFGDDAFYSYTNGNPTPNYSNLRGTYEKELFTQKRILNGKGPLISDVSSLRYYPEEALGFRQAFRNFGLFPNSTVNYLNQVNSYWSQVYGTNLINDKAWYNFIYKIPRRW